MPTFTYRARTAQGEFIAGTIEALSDREVLTALKNKNLMPIRITSARNQRKSNKKISTKDVAIFSRQLATLVETGTSFVTAMDILVRQTENRRFAEIISEIKNNIESGTSIAESFGRHPKVFSRLYTNMLAAAEEGGGLDRVLDRLAIHLEKSVALQSKIKSSMTYPVSVLVIAIGITYFMLTVIVPKFAEILTQMDTEMPPITRFLLAVSGAAQNSLIPLAIGIPVAAFIFRKVNATPAGRRRFDSLKLRIPLLGQVIKKGGIATFSSTLALLLNSGVNIVQALEITRAVSGNILIEDAIRNARLNVETGSTMSSAFEATPIFPPMVTSMIAIGEESGSLDLMLQKVSDFYEREVEDAIEAMTSAIEPALMVFLGLVVGTIVIGLFTPMFSVMGTLTK